MVTKRISKDFKPKTLTKNSNYATQAALTTRAKPKVAHAVTTNTAKIAAHS